MRDAVKHTLDDIAHMRRVRSAGATAFFDAIVWCAHVLALARNVALDVKQARGVANRVAACGAAARLMQVPLQRQTMSVGKHWPQWTLRVIRGPS